VPAVVARVEKGRARAAYFPREVFFGFGFPGTSLPAAAARFFCFFVATNPPRLGAIRSDADVTRLAAYSSGYPAPCPRSSVTRASGFPKPLPGPARRESRPTTAPHPPRPHTPWAPLGHTPRASRGTLFALLRKSQACDDRSTRFGRNGRLKPLDKRVDADFSFSPRLGEIHARLAGLAPKCPSKESEGVAGELSRKVQPPARSRPPRQKRLAKAQIDQSEPHRLATDVDHLTDQCARQDSNLRPLPPRGIAAQSRASRSTFSGSHAQGGCERGAAKPHRTAKCARQDSNLRPLPPQGSALSPELRAPGNGQCSRARAEPTSSSASSGTLTRT
jgi:hypothetical protein